VTEIQTRRTWPCGYQESVTLRTGWFSSLRLTADDDLPPKLCPLHAEHCHR